MSEQQWTNLLLDQSMSYPKIVELLQKIVDVATTIECLEIYCWHLQFQIYVYWYDQ